MAIQIASYDKPSVRAEVDATPHALRVALYDQSGNPIISFGGSSTQAAPGYTRLEDGSTTQLGTIDSHGNLAVAQGTPAAAGAPWPVSQGQPAQTTGTITANLQTVSAAITGYVQSIITLHGTYAGVTFNIEASDDGGTTWYQVGAQDDTLGNYNPGNGHVTPGSNATKSYRVNHPGYTTLRVRADGYSSGTATVNINPVASPTAINPGTGYGLPVTIFGGSNSVPAGSPADASAPSSALNVGSYPSVYDPLGNSYNRVRGNYNVPAATLGLASAASTVATRTGADQTTSNANWSGKGLLLHVAISAYAGAATFTPSLQWKTAAGTYLTVWTAAAALSGNGDYSYRLYPSALDLGGVTEEKQIPLPKDWRVLLTYSGNGTTDAATTLAEGTVLI